VFVEFLLAAAFQVGPFYEQKADYAALRPFYSREGEVTDVLWPVFTKHRSWWRFCYILNDYEQPDGQSQFTVFPFWWHGQDRQSGKYAGLFPIYGRHPHVAFLYDFEFALWPLWTTYRTPRASKNEWMRTDAVLFPFFHTRSDGSWGIWPLCGLGRQRESEHRYLLWPFITWANYQPDRDTSGEGLSSMFWPICASVKRERETQVMVVPPFFSYARTDSACRWRLPWPLVEVEYGVKRNRVSVFPFYERTEDFDYAKRKPVNKVTRFGWRLVELYEDETRVFPFWKNGRGHFRLWPFWETFSTEDGGKNSRALALFPIRNVPAVDRNWSKFWTFYERYELREHTEHSLFWGLIRWRGK
jgi:hypothetical protein